MNAVVRKETAGRKNILFISIASSPASRTETKTFHCSMLELEAGAYLNMSSFHKFVKEDPAPDTHFPSQIWGTLIAYNRVHIFQIRDGKSSINHPFAVAYLGNSMGLDGSIFCSVSTKQRICIGTAL